MVKWAIGDAGGVKSGWVVRVGGECVPVAVAVGAGVGAAVGCIAAVGGMGVDVEVG
jgi:hypothetical protein